MENGLMIPEAFEPAFVPEEIQNTDPLSWDEFSVEEHADTTDFVEGREISLFEAESLAKQNESIVNLKLENNSEKGHVDWQPEDVDRAELRIYEVTEKVKAYEPEFD